MNTLRAMVITDIHHGRDMCKTPERRKLGSWGSVLFKQFQARAHAYSPDFIGNLGDNLIACAEDSTAEDYRRWNSDLQVFFNHFSVPIGHTQGNHDLGIAQQLSGDPEFPVKPPSQIIDTQNGYRSIFWNADADVWKAKTSSAGAMNKEWLKNALDRTDKPTVVFTHAPFEYYQDEEDIYKTLREHGNVILGMHGHKHKNDRIEIHEGIPYFTQQSFTEAQIGQPYPWGAYSGLEINEEQISIARKNLMGLCSDDEKFVLPRTSFLTQQEIKREGLLAQCAL